MANYRIFLLTICFFILVVFPKNGICSGSDDGIKAIKAGYKLVENFYSCLTLGTSQGFCDKVFLDDPYLSKNEVVSIWKYLSENKKLFVYKSNVIKEKDFFKWSRKTVSYFNPKNLDKISDGYLYITVVHTLPNQFYSGIYKEIAFPIVKDDTCGEYRIEFRNIKINGIIIDFDNEFTRDFDIVENLGFKVGSCKSRIDKK